MQSEEKTALRALIWCVPVASIVAYAFNALHHRDWAVCYVIGALLSIFSLFSLTVFVPMLIRPGARPYVKGILVLTLFLKLPIFMLALYFMTRLAASGAAASVFGIALAPMVITMKAIVNLVYHPRVKASMPEPAAQHKPQTSTARRRASQQALPTEGG